MYSNFLRESLFCVVSVSGGGVCSGVMPVIVMGDVVTVVVCVTVAVGNVFGSVCGGKKVKVAAEVVGVECVCDELFTFFGGAGFLKVLCVEDVCCGFFGAGFDVCLAGSFCGDVSDVGCVCVWSSCLKFSGCVVSVRM